MSKHGARILIVDDNVSNLDVLTRHVQRLGMQPFTAKDGQLAMNRLNSEPFDLVLLDIMMPNMNGMQVLSRIKEDPELRGIPVIIISAVEDTSSIARCIELGAEDFLAKPFNPQILQARISASLEKKQLRDKSDDFLEEQSTLQRISSELNSRLDINTVSEIVLSWAMKRTTSHLGMVGRLMEKEQGMTVLAIEGESPILNRFHGQKVRIDHVEFERAISSCMPQESNQGDGFLLPDSVKRLVFPIGRPGFVSALLILEDTVEVRYESKVLSFLTQLSDRAGPAMANAILYEQVQMANQSKTEFISDVSHELKNPMTSIKNYARLLLTDKSFSEQQVGFIDVIQRSVDRMSRMVSDLSDVSRIESGYLRLEIDRVPAKDVVQAVVTELESQINNKKQFLRVEFQNDDLLIKADQNRLVQILINLVSNAHKYSPEESKISIWVGQNDEEMIEFRVRDQGIGIRPEDTEKIFTKYFRASDSAARSVAGTGLGLNISRQLVLMQGGKIWFESDYGDGSMFAFTLPAYQLEDIPVK
ncbi:MAG: signal transduction histidine kinase [Candidatus Promineifilaceae bacterium]|jgi:signal transduction histidine kinase